MKTNPCLYVVGVLFLTGSAIAASPVAQAPLQSFGYHNQTASTSLPVSDPASWTTAPDNRLAVQGIQLDDRSMRYLDEHVTQPRDLLPHGLVTHEFPRGSQLTAVGPFAPSIPGDPHADQARFTLIGLNW